MRPPAIQTLQMHDIATKDSAFIVASDAAVKVRSLRSVSAAHHPKEGVRCGGVDVSRTARFGHPNKFTFSDIDTLTALKRDGASSSRPSSRNGVPKIHRVGVPARPKQPNPAAAAVIPLPANHIKRTESELQLWEENVRAEYRDRAMYHRCYAAVNHGASWRRHRRASLQEDATGGGVGGGATATTHAHAVTPPTHRRASDPNPPGEDWTVGDAEDGAGRGEAGGNGWLPSCPAIQKSILRKSTIGSNAAGRHDDDDGMGDGAACDDDEVFLIEDL